MFRRTNRTWLTIAFVLSACLLVAHLFALERFWYWEYHWSDIPMHILGGAAIGSFLMAFGTARRTFPYFAYIIALVVIWKLFEYFGHVSIRHPYDWLGNLKDFVTSIIGSFIPLIIARKTTWR